MDEYKSRSVNPDIGNVTSVSVTPEGDDIMYEDGDAETMDESEYQNSRISEEKATQNCDHLPSQ